MYISLEGVLSFHSFGNCSQNAAEGIISFQKNETNDSTTVTGNEMTHFKRVSQDLYQTIDGQYKRLGIYKPDENRTYYENYPPSRIPSDKLDRVYILLPAPVGALLMVGLVACILLTILNTFLFMFYRKEPEIKASSFSLSMIIFLGCYLMYTGTGIHIIVNGRPFHDNVVCLAEIWTIYVGTDLTFSTILVKVCRIRHIF